VTASPRIRRRRDERLWLLEGVVGAPLVLEDLKHKPGRRRTLRARGPRRTAIVKIYATERAETVARRVAVLGGGPPEPLVPRLLLVVSTLRMVVLSDVPGRPLRYALLAGDAATCRRAGAAVGAWHRSWRSREPAALRRHTVERELEILSERARGVSEAISSVVLAAARDLSEPWSFPTVVHRDLYEEQVLFGGAIGLIDLDDAALGPPELDLGNLLAHVELLSLRSGRDLEPMTDQLLAGYAGSGAALEPVLLDRCRRLALLRLACIHDEPAVIELALRPASPSAGARRAFPGAPT
jgi:Ser/Thr protein kinase RdoA (MazF antagonist)